MPVLGYWKIRGLAQPIRLLLHYCGEEFEDKTYRYQTIENEDGSKITGWKDDKFELGMDFPNLPYYIDEHVTISQSNAILRYVANKYNMGGKTNEQRALFDMLQDEVMDLRNGFVKLCYGASFDENKAAYLKSAEAKFASFEKFLGDKQWLAGDDMCAADFHFYEMICAHQILEETMLHSNTKILEFKERFENLPKVKQYIESEQYLSEPFNSSHAKFPGQKLSTNSA